MDSVVWDLDSGFESRLQRYSYVGLDESSVGLESRLEALFSEVEMADKDHQFSVNVVTLDRDNYPRWSLVVENVLRGNGLWPHVLGKVTKPDEDYSTETTTEKWSKWDRKDSKAKSIILASLNETDFNHVRDCATSEKIWERIRELREPKTTDILMSAMTDFFNTRWETDDDVSTFISKLSVVASRIKSCNDEDVKIVDRWLIAKTLSSLPQQFSSFIQSWNLMSTGTAEMSDFRQKLLTAERGMSTDQSSIARTGEAYGAFRPPMKSSSVAAAGTKKKFTGKCRYCDKVGHKEAECHKKARDEDAKKISEKKPTQHSKQDPKSSLVATYALRSESESMNIIVDSGASHHVTSRHEWFTSLRQLDSPIRLGIGDGKHITASHSGSIDVEVSPDGNSWTPMSWDDVLYAPDAGDVTLFSTVFMDRMKGYGFEHRNGRMALTKNGRTIVGGTWNGTVYAPFIRVIPASGVAMVAQTINVWHNRLGHISDDMLRLMERNHLVDGLTILPSKRSACDACHMGRQTASVHPRREPRNCLPGERFHTDVCHVNVLSWNKCVYFITFKDESSGYRGVYCLQSKTEVASRTKHFLDHAANVTGRKCISLKSDNGTEYINKDVEALLTDRGIDHERSAPFVKQGNGMAERENRTLCDTMRSLLFNADISKSERNLLWTEALATAAYLRNRVPNRGRNDVTPFELWTGKKPNVGHLRTFGSAAYVKVPECNRRKLDSKSLKTVFVGYESLTDHVVRVYDRDRRVVERVSDVIVEDARTEHESSLIWPLPSFDDDLTELDVDDVANDDPVHDNDNEEQNEPKKRGRPRGPTIPKASIPHPMNTRSKTDGLLMMAAASDPTSVADALSREDGTQWRKAMDEEMDSLRKNGTWILESLPPNRKTISAKWIFKSKLNADGSLNRYKARLVARGFSQVPGLDFTETFSPVVRNESLRCVLAIAASRDMEIAQFDVKTAFLNGPLNEVVFMDQPEMFEDGSGKVCRLLRSLYGLKQAPRNWNARFHNFLTNIGFECIPEDRCVYRMMIDGDGLMLLLLYVDDGLVFSTSKSSMDAFMVKLEAEFEITRSDSSLYVGIEINRDRDAKTICINQRGYVNRVLQRFGLSDAKPAASPLDPTLKLTKATDEDDQFECPYREAIGALNYISVNSRPDITFAVNRLASFCVKPTSTHWLMVKRVMRYLKGTLDFALTFGNVASELIGYCDSDWAGDTDERRSTSGFVFTLFGGPVAWSSGMQELSALSVCEAEYVSLASCLQECLWLRPFLASLGLDISKPTPINCDNQASIALAKNPEFHKRTKHVGIRYHRVRQEQEIGTVIVKYVPTDQNPADMLTKALNGKDLHRELRLLSIDTTRRE